MIRELIAVGIGGAAGSAARYAISCWMLAGHTLLGFPAGTFAVNAAGSLLIGILLESLSSAAAGWLLVTGLRGGDYGPAAAYIVLSAAVCIAFAALGMWIGHLSRN